MKYIILLASVIVDYYIAFSKFGIATFPVALFLILLHQKYQLSYQTYQPKNDENSKWNQLNRIEYLLFLMAMGIITESLNGFYFGSICLLYISSFYFLSRISNNFSFRRKNYAYLFFNFALFSIFWLIYFIIIADNPLTIFDGSNIISEQKRWILLVSWFKMNITFGCLFVITFGKKLRYG